MSPQATREPTAAAVGAHPAGFLGNPARGLMGAAAGWRPSYFGGSSGAGSSARLDTLNTSRNLAVVQ